MYDWDPLNCEFPNRVMVQIWDQYAQDHSAKEFFGNSIVPDDSDQSHIIRGDTLEQLVANVRERLARFRETTGGIELAADFLPRLEQTIARWNQMAEQGVDEDFHRGEREVELTVFAGPLSEEAAARKNPVMRALQPEGPYYACLLSGGTLDTRAGRGSTRRPRSSITTTSRSPASTASATAWRRRRRAYWAGGGTLGPMIAFAYRAAQAIDDEPVRDLGAVRRAAA
ncbi:MAG: hypothetical protein R2736_14590 [Solirubrobacterales bacterium]